MPRVNERAVASVLCGCGPGGFLGAGGTRMRRGRAGSTLALALALGLAALLGGCGDWLVRSANEDVERTLAEHQPDVEGFRAQSVRGQGADWEPPIAIPGSLTLVDAVRIATLGNREYMSRREGVYLSGLGLALTRHQLKDPIFSGQLAYLFNGQRLGPTVNQGVATLGVTQVLPTGGSVNVTGNASLTQQSSGLPGSQAGAGVSVNVNQPLLRGVGSYAFESLTQGERDLVYALRDFELYRQGFAIDVVSRYYGLVQQRQRVTNARRNAEVLEFVARRAKAFFDVGRENMNKIEKLRADQAYLRAKNGVIDEEQGYRLALDRFKVFLGLKVATELDVPETASPPFVPVSLDLETCVQSALAKRLDIQSAHDRVLDAERQLGVAQNQLWPDLNLTGGYSIASDGPPGSRGTELGFRNDFYSAGLTLVLPLERTAERNAYRAALIRVEQARRALRDAEDNLIVQVRDSLRSLRQKEESIKIQKEIIETETARARYSEIQYAAGEIGTRDLTESRDSLLAAQNDSIQAIVSYEIQRLNLLREIGALGVREDGTLGE